MLTRGTASRGLWAYVILAVVRAAMTGDQDISSRDGCRVRPTEDCIGTHADCSRRHLDHIPDDLPVDVRALTMRHNFLTRLSDYSLTNYTALTSLDLSRSNIRTLSVHAFSGLSRLVTLDLTYNLLCLTTDAYPVGLFRGMTSLRRITMTSNTCKTRHVAYPDETLADLPGLEYLSMTGLPNSRLGEGFGRMTNLKTLVFTGHGCNMSALHDTTFISLTNVSLTHLCIKACRLTKIEPGALKPLSHMKTLNMACNQMVDFTAIHAAIAAANDTRLETLVVDDVTPSGLLLNRAHFAHIALSRIERLSIRANAIVQLDITLFRPLKGLRHVNVGYSGVVELVPSINRTAAVIDVLMGLNLDVADASEFFTDRNVYRHRYCFREEMSSTEDPTDPTEYFFRKTPTVGDLDFSRPPPPKMACHAGKTHSEQKHCHTIPPSVQVIYADSVSSTNQTRKHIKVELNVSADNDVVVLNVSHNAMFTSIGPIHGLRRCQLIDFSHCKIAGINAEAFDDMPMLRYLFLSDNVIGDKNHDLHGIFDGSSTIEVLDLSGNAISHIHVSAFSGLVNLRTLALSRNLLKSVDFDIRALHLLTYMNLARNEITVFDVKTSNKSCVYVDLFANPPKLRNPFGCTKPVVADETVRCTTGTSTQHPAFVTGGITTQPPRDVTSDKPSSVNHKPGWQRTLLIAIGVIVGVLLVAAVVIVVVVVTKERRRRQLCQRLGTIFGCHDYFLVDDSVPLSATATG